jgi:hypothetical protein
MKGVRVVTRQEQRAVQRPDNVSSNAAPAAEARGKESKERFGVHSVGKEKGDMAGRAYEYFHRLQ